jgi:hypothetical protein
VSEWLRQAAAFPELAALLKPAVQLLCRSAGTCLTSAARYAIYDSAPPASPVPCRCPGGDQQAGNSADVAKRGLRFSCWKATPPNSTFFNEAHVAALGLTTKSSRAAKHTDCYPLPGWYLAVATQNAQSAALCSGATYSPGYARIRACLPCQSGLVLDATYAGDPDLPKVDRLQVCSKCTALLCVATAACAVDVYNV